MSDPDNRIVRFTQHARDQMAERAFTQEEVEAVIRDPSVEYTGTDGKPNVHGTTPSGHAMRVVMVYDETSVLVITVVRL
jgi:Domain of unknown function (DUF4258)